MIEREILSQHATKNLIKEHRQGRDVVNVNNYSNSMRTKKEGT